MEEEAKKTLEDYFHKGIFAILLFIALIAVVQLYFSVNSLLSIWLNYRYQPIFQALFSIAVLAICIYILKERLIAKSK